MKSITLFFLLFMLFFSLCFSIENAYFIITQKDVEIHIPKGFPKPVYDFKSNKISPEGFVLGRKLFYDPILSCDSSTSCASCHQRFVAFAHIDHALSHGINGLIGNRNVPALQNLIWQKSFMWDGAINHIELQPLAPITNKVEMGDTLPHILQKLQQSKEYVSLFQKAFKDTTVTSEKLFKSLTQFLGLMISNNSHYDKFIRGEEKLSMTEMKGLKLFRSHCANCHTEPLFTDNSFRNIGLKPDTVLKDYGRIKITGIASDTMKFKVPSLRNVEITYPYMHDGRFRNLEQVLNYYSIGNFATSYFDESIKLNVGLTKEEQQSIITFLKTLTDKTYTYDRRFADPNSNN